MNWGNNRDRQFRPAYPGDQKGWNVWFCFVYLKFSFSFFCLFYFICCSLNLLSRTAEHTRMSSKYFQTCSTMYGACDVSLCSSGLHFPNQYKNMVSRLCSVCVYVLRSIASSERLFENNRDKQLRQVRKHSNKREKKSNGMNKSRKVEIERLKNVIPSMGRVVNPWGTYPPTQRQKGLVCVLYLYVYVHMCECMYIEKHSFLREIFMVHVTSACAHQDYTSQISTKIWYHGCARCMCICIEKHSFLRETFWKQQRYTTKTSQNQQTNKQRTNSK